MSGTMAIEIRPYHAADKDAVIALWGRCKLLAPANHPEQDIERKLTVNPELFLVAVADERIIGTCMAGYEGHRGWINYLAVTPEYQQQGIARRLMQVAEDKLRALGCPKINLQIRETNTHVIEFYQRLGFDKDHVVSMGKRLVRDPEYHS